MSACLQNKKSKMQPWFWSSIGSDSRDWRKEKKWRWEKEEARKQFLMVLNNADG